MIGEFILWARLQLLYNYVLIVVNILTSVRSILNMNANAFY